MASQPTSSLLQGTYTEASQHTSSVLQGSYTELLHIGEEPTKLFLLFGNRFDASRCFKSGDLFVHLITGSASPVAVISFMVADHKWMLAKDSMVLRVAPQAFVLFLPGFLYGLTLHRASSHNRNKLEGILRSFSSYQDLLLEGESEQEEVGTETDIWRLAYSRIERLAGAAVNSIVDGVADINSMEGKHQRATMASLLVKLVSRNLLSGALSSLNHVHIVVAPGGQESGGLYFLPSMWAFTDLLDVMEPGSPLPVAAAAAYLLDADLLYAIETGSLRALPLPAAATTTLSVGQDGYWYFNKKGILLLLTDMISLLERVLDNLTVARLVLFDVEPEEVVVVEPEEAVDESDRGEVITSSEAMGSVE